MKARIGDIDIEYGIVGRGPWITLSHSLAADQRIWEPQVEVLRKYFTVLTYDTRGHGGTTATPGPYTLEQLVQDVLGLLDHLGVERTHWLGLSMGGMIGQELALRAPLRTDRMMLADTTGRLPAELSRSWAERGRAVLATGLSGSVQPTLDRWFTMDFRRREPELMDRIGAMIAATPAEGYAGCCAAIAGVDTLDRLGGLRQPALVLVGENDPSTPPCMAESIAVHWPGAELVVLPGAAHLANLEQAAAFNSAMLRFLGVPDCDRRSGTWPFDA